jgi:hypothetical protein
VLLLYANSVYFVKTNNVLILRCTILMIELYIITLYLNSVAYKVRAPTYTLFALRTLSGASSLPEQR